MVHGIEQMQKNLKQQTGRHAYILAFKHLENVVEFVRALCTTIIIMLSSIQSFHC